MSAKSLMIHPYGFWLTASSLINFVVWMWGYFTIREPVPPKLLSAKEMDVVIKARQDQQAPKK